MTPESAIPAIVAAAGAVICASILRRVRRGRREFVHEPRHLRADSELTRPCPACGARAGSTERVCRACGAQLPSRNLLCPKCGLMAGASGRFCRRCRTQLA
jgi:hypothetical protein